MEPSALATTSATDDDYGFKSKGGISGYPALSMDDGDTVVAEEEEDFGGLMAWSTVDLITLCSNFY